MIKNDFSAAQLLEAVKSNIVTFEDFVNEMRADVADERLHAHIDKMLLKIYVQWREGSYISKMQACRMIPADHIDTCKRYVARAQELNLVDFVPDPKDGRRTNVVPTDTLIQYVEERARKSLSSAHRILSMKH